MWNDFAEPDFAYDGHALSVLYSILKQDRGGHFADCKDVVLDSAMKFPEAMIPSYEFLQLSLRDR